MPVSTKLLAAGKTDTGRVRRQNEDRIHVDTARGIFIVADGLGGHAAGERAAETAVKTIAARLERQTGTTEERIREAITLANNEIYRLSTTVPEFKGMASVVTLAVVEDEQVHVGHVGDSRLYVLQPGGIRKATRDHSPVGELEDSGTLSEAAAMAHPRRNEVFRDLGSEPHGPDDADFIDVVRFSMRPDSALLICSDGLSDQVAAERIRAIVEAHPRDPARAADALVDAANAAGGKDNVSVVLVEGPDFGAPAARTQRGAAAAAPAIVTRRGMHPALLFGAGFATAVALFAMARPYVVEAGWGWGIGFGNVRDAATLTVGPGAKYASIGAALKDASAGDTVSVAPGVYRESVRLKPGVTLVSAQRRAAAIESAETAVWAEDAAGARLSGFRIAGAGHIGIRITRSDVQVTDVEVTGMGEAGIEIDGEGSAAVMASEIVDNRGTGIVVEGGAKPLIAHNVITGNGNGSNGPRPGIHVAGASAPVIRRNVVAGNGVEQIWVSPLFNADRLAVENTIAPGVKDRTRAIKVVTR